MGNITQLVSDANLDTGELRQHVTETHDCKRIVDDSSDEELA